MGMMDSPSANSNSSTRSHCGVDYYADSMIEASENASVACSESLYNYAYSLGLGHEQADSFVKSTLTKETCVSQGSKKRTEPRKIFYKETMRCIIN